MQVVYEHVFITKVRENVNVADETNVQNLQGLATENAKQYKMLVSQNGGQPKSCQSQIYSSTNVIVNPTSD